MNLDKFYGSNGNPRKPENRKGILSYEIRFTIFWLGNIGTHFPRKFFLSN